jgi:hypothetical protein
MQTNKLKHLKHAEAKNAIAKKHGYSGYYDMVVCEYRKNVSSRDIAKVFDVGKTSIVYTLKALGEPVRPRGGANHKGKKARSWMHFQG